MHAGKVSSCALGKSALKRHTVISSEFPPPSKFGRNGHKTLSYLGGIFFCFVFKDPPLPLG